MTIHYEDGTVTLHHGDALEVARTMPDGSVDCIVTSPPYFGLRDYGAVGQMGAEETLAEYVAGMVALFRELRRVLADDGTLWLNLGDTYGKSKRLHGVPWRVALALDADGWILRSDIIWNKPGAMPESVSDRVSKSHEYLFMLVKQPNYFYDAGAILDKAKTNVKNSQGERGAQGYAAATAGTRGSPQRSHSGGYGYTSSGMRNKRSVWEVNTIQTAFAHFAVFPPALVRPCIRAGCKPGGTVLDPFSGSGTTGMVATEEGRKYVGIDINSDYLDLSLRTRFAQPVLDFGEMTA